MWAECSVVLAYPASVLVVLILWVRRFQCDLQFLSVTTHPHSGVCRSPGCRGWGDAGAGLTDLEAEIAHLKGEN